MRVQDDADTMRCSNCGQYWNVYEPNGNPAKHYCSTHSAPQTTNAVLFEVVDLLKEIRDVLQVLRSPMVFPEKKELEDGSQKATDEA